MNQVGDSTACRVFVVIECKLRYTEMSTPSRSLGHPVYKHRCGDTGARTLVIWKATL